MPAPSGDPVTHLAPAIEFLTGHPAAPDAMTRFRQYLALLLDWNRIHRLTGHQSPDAIVGQLFLDALLFLARLPSGPLTIADLGTGPGIPGVPIRIIRPEIALTLVESRRKHVSFLATLKRKLDLPDLVVLEGRAEKLVVERPALAEAFDVVVTRAVGVGLVPAATRYLKPGGLFVAGGQPFPTENPGETAEGELKISWEAVIFDKLGLSRAFLVGRKPS
jgi:16S rRNA (guanine527-N7)-methyltransferase